MGGLNPVFGPVGQDYSKPALLLYCMWQRKPLDDEQLDRLIDTAEGLGSKYEFTIRVLAYTGLRANEFSQMTSDWVDFQGEKIRVPKGADVKSRHAVRTIPIKDPDTYRILRDYFKLNDAVGVTRQAITNRVKKVAENANIKQKVTPHVLRHTYGSMIARRGATAQYIRQTMGHADLSSANNYLQYTGNQLDEEAEELF